MEIEEMLGNISERKTEPIVLNSYLIPAVSNVICSLVMSVRFHKDESRFVRLMAHIEEGFRLFTVVGAAAFMPFLRFLRDVLRDDPNNSPMGYNFRSSGARAAVPCSKRD